MRRSTRLGVVLSAMALVVGAAPLFARQHAINPRIPPPPPPPEVPAPPVREPAAPSATPTASAPFPVPETVVVPPGTRFAVVLDTPLTTRISKPGQSVTFRTTESLLVDGNLAIPPGTAFLGKVIQASRPGSFGKAGQLRVKVEELQLSTGARAAVIARLDTLDADKQGRISSDNNRTANLYSLAMWTAQGTLLGAQIHGGKGAAMGAGAGAAVALILLISRHGPDVYLEPGTPFLVILDEPVSLSGRAVLAAQQGTGIGTPGGPTAPQGGKDAGRKVSSADNSVSPSGNASSDPSDDPDRPKLKHRPKPQP